MAERFRLLSGEVVTNGQVDGGTVFLRDEQCVDELLSKCADERAQDGLRGHRKTAPFRCIMELPMVLVESLKAQGMDIIADKAALRRVVNDPAFAAFRTSAGKL